MLRTRALNTAHTGTSVASPPATRNTPVMPRDRAAPVTAIEIGRELRKASIIRLITRPCMSGGVRAWSQDMN